MKRYPGIQSFDQDRRHLFFGREREIKELFRLAVLQPIVVLFGKSGTGKTSLIQAGITPLLHERRLHPVFLRLNQTQLPIPEQIHSILNAQEYLPYNTPNNLSLWDYCHLFDYNEGGDAYTPLIVLDQFEELFTLYAEQIDEQKRFIAQLAQVMNGTAPEGNRRTAPPKVHFLISIRSDHLYLLDRLSDQIPAILRTRYELYDLDADNARLAIEKPAAAEGNFDSPPFVYSPDALQNIISELSQEQQANAANAKNEVGGFQLQLLCQRIEEKVIEHISKNPTSPKITITPNFYRGSEGIRHIIGEFYDSVLQKYPQTDTRNRIQQVVEQGLISNGRRVILEQEQIKHSYKLSQADLEQLTATRLCRKENRAGLWYYEISHDTLLKPILRARNIRQQAEGMQRHTQKVKRWFDIVMLLLAILAVMVLFALWALQQRNEVERQKEAFRNAVYFYDNKFALTSNYIDFYFIDKNGNEVEKLGRWQKAEQFDYYMGYAKVENDNKTYLLDTLGESYRVAYDIKDLHPGITALDLSNKGLDSLPSQVGQHSPLQVLLLNNNQLSTLPDEITQLKNLRLLYLTGNPITETEIFKIKKLLPNCYIKL